MDKGQRLFNSNLILFIGEMDFSDAYRLISEYNREYRLGISESNITKTLNNCNKGGQVVLDALVKSLMMYEVWPWPLNVISKVTWYFIFSPIGYAEKCKVLWVWIKFVKRLRNSQR